MALINPVVQLANVANHKDSRWLTLEVCREFQRSKCSRSDQECKFAHPPPHVEVQNGRVTCCFDSIKGKCARKDPPCKYLHPPQHLREQLLQNGRNNLILRNIQMQALAAQVTTGLPPMVPSMMPVAYDASGKPISYSPAMIPGQTYLQSPYIAASQSYPYSAMTSMSGILPTAVTSDPSAITHPQAAASPNSVTTTVSAHKIQRPDRLEQYTGGIPQTAMGFPPTMLNYYNYKRPALADGKSGLPVYQPATMVNYQTLAAMQMAGQPQAYVPMSFAGHPPNMPRF